MRKSSSLLPIEASSADAAPEQIVMADRSFGAPQKARDAEQYLFTQSTYREFPDLWTGTSLASATKISNANPQDSQYPRGTVELVSWMNGDGRSHFIAGHFLRPDQARPRTASCRAHRACRRS